MGASDLERALAIAEKRLEDAEEAWRVANENRQAAIEFRNRIQAACAEVRDVLAEKFVCTPAATPQRPATTRQGRPPDFNVTDYVRTQVAKYSAEFSRREFIEKIIHDHPGYNAQRLKTYIGSALCYLVARGYLTKRNEGDKIFYTRTDKFRATAIPPSECNNVRLKIGEVVYPSAAKAIRDNNLHPRIHRGLREGRLSIKGQPALQLNQQGEPGEEREKVLAAKRLVYECGACGEHYAERKSQCVKCNGMSITPVEVLAEVTVGNSCAEELPERRGRKDGILGDIYQPEVNARP